MIYGTSTPKAFVVLDVENLSILRPIEWNSRERAAFAILLI